MKTIKLYNNVEIPMVGLGTYQLMMGLQSYKTVLSSLKIGYRHIDTARIYLNERSVGQAIKRSKLPREQIFVTTKMWNNSILNKKGEQAFKNSLKRLGLKYIDLYLLHWPIEGYLEAYKVLEKLYAEKQIRSFGVSNFLIRHLENLKAHGLKKPMVNQIEINPYYQNDELIDYCQKNDIVVEAYSPLGGSKYSCLHDETLSRIAKKYQVSTSQVILKWLTQRNIIVLPRSKNIDHIKNNLELDSFVLSDKDISDIKTLNKNFKTGDDPEVYE